MYVSDLALDSFRSYESLVTQFPPGIVILHGRNGRGKTNIVEAIGYLSTLSSHRVSSDRNLVKRGASAAVIRAKVNDERESILEVEIVPAGANRARVNRTVTAPRDLVGILRSVVFAPEDLQLVRGEPAGRRRFLDQIITQMKPSFTAVKRDYERILLQRSAVLKDVAFSGDSSTLDVWDEALVTAGAQVGAHRRILVESLAPHLITAYSDIADDSKLAGVTYRGGDAEENLSIPVTSDGYFPDTTALSADLKDLYYTKLQTQRSEELRRRQNLVGPHREDFDLVVDDFPVKGFASHGETWSSVLALRLAQVEVLTSHDTTPVLVLDDVFAELDVKRRLALVERISGVEQVFITAAAVEDLPPMEGAQFSVSWDPEQGSSIE